MSTELINRITIKKDGVYLSSRSSNVTDSFRSHRIKELSETYKSEDQSGLDREMIRSLYEYAELRGSHKSLKRYHYATQSSETFKIYKKYTDQIDDRYESMDKTDQDSVWYKPTEKAKEYLRFEQNLKDKMYSEIAQICEEYDKK